MKVVPLEGNTMTVPELVEMVRSGEAVILTREGQPFVSIRDISGSDWESASLAQNPQFQSLIERSRRSYRDEGGISLGALRRELGLEASEDRVDPDSPPDESGARSPSSESP